MGKVNSFLLCKQEEDIEVVEERAYVNWAMVQKCIVLVVVVVLVIVLVLCCVVCRVKIHKIKNKNKKKKHLEEAELNNVRNVKKICISLQIKFLCQTSIVIRVYFFFF